MKKIAILGSTGSIGTSTLQIARHLKSELKVIALAARSNIDLLEKQAIEFSPEIIGVYDEEKALELQKRLPSISVVGGMEGLNIVASYANVDFVVSAISGTMGLPPTVAAIKAKKTIGLANKEALVSGGAYIISLAKEMNVSIIPIDSEHSALFQCLQGENIKTINRMILTASGGPFRTFTEDQLQHITIEQALNHPTWKMGPKVTIDCSTLMNKGLEVIEAHWLFGISPNKIEVLIHPQSIVHSMIEFIDCSILAQMGDPSMITPIQYALTYPQRKKSLLAPFDFTKHHTLQFFLPDTKRFRCLKLAFEAMQAGGSLACYMNAANEVLVEKFINKEISWMSISEKLERLMNSHEISQPKNLEEILEIDSQARKQALYCN